MKLGLKWFAPVAALAATAMALAVFAPPAFAKGGVGPAGVPTTAGPCVFTDFQIDGHMFYPLDLPPSGVDAHPGGVLVDMVWSTTEIGAPGGFLLGCLPRNLR